jgi:hypothetical protein
MIISDEKTINKIFEKIMNNEVVENVSPMDALFGNVMTVRCVIAEAKAEVIDEKIAALEAEYEEVANRTYRKSNKKIAVGDGLNAADVHVNYINEGRRKRILENIAINIQDLKEEKASI